MARCYYCHVYIESDNVHKEACLTRLPEGEAKNEAVRAWNLGFRDGQEGIVTEDAQKNPYYQLGYSVEKIKMMVDDIDANDNEEDEFADDDDGLGKRCVDPYKLIRAGKKNLTDDDKSGK